MTRSGRRRARLAVECWYRGVEASDRSDPPARPRAMRRGTRCSERYRPRRRGRRSGRGAEQLRCRSGPSPIRAVPLRLRPAIGVGEGGHEQRRGKNDPHDLGEPAASAAQDEGGRKAHQGRKHGGRTVVAEVRSSARRKKLIGARPALEATKARPGQPSRAAAARCKRRRSGLPGRR